MKVRLRWRSQKRESVDLKPPPITPPPLETKTAPPPIPAAKPEIRASIKEDPAPSASGKGSIIGGFMIEAYGASDPGCIRGNNEDYYLVAPSIGLYVVADGMGGAQAGEHASKLAAETLWEIVYQDKVSMDADGLVAAFQEANRRVMQAAAADSSLEGMGTTLVAALERSNKLIVASVGDSRLYQFNNGELKAITEDQTWVNEVGRRLGLDDQALRTHPMRHVLTMAVGVSPQLRVNTYTLEPTPPEQLLMCSDGLHGVVTDEEIRKVLASDTPGEEKCHQLLEAAKTKGGPDNITVVLLKATAGESSASD